MTATHMHGVVWSLVGALIAVMVLVTPMPRVAHAATSINQSNVDLQMETVKSHLITTMEEDVKLLQMMIIVRLEAQLAALQAAAH